MTSEETATITLEAIADGLLAALIAVVVTYARKILKALDQRLERRMPPAATVAPDVPKGKP